MRKVFIRLVILVALVSCSEPLDWQGQAADPEFLHQSVKQVTDVIVHDIFSPPVAARIYAYMSVAGYEASIAGDPRFVTLAKQLNGLEPLPKPEEGFEYCYPLAAVQAMLAVGKALVFSENKIDAFHRNIMNQFLASGVPADVFERSVSYGTAVANHIIDWSGKDNYKQTRSYPKYTIETENPATWKPTPPAYMDAIEPHWNKIRTFVIDSAQQFKPVPPTPFSTDEKSRFYQEAMEVYEIGKELSKEQQEIASFWDCNPFMMNVRGHVMFATKKISPGGHWMNITRVACKKANKDFAESAEAYVRVSLALIDGFISCWDEKYRTRVIRPESYINQYIDENWTPLLQTPPFPEYTSGHSVISSASAVILTKLFGHNFSFTDSTEVEFGLPPRNFKSFIEAAEEAAISRLYGGIHYRPAVINGVNEGSAIGNFINKKINTRREEVAHAK